MALMNKLISVLPLLVSVFCRAASAETVRWIGGPAEPQWSSAENWDASRVPGPLDDVVIAGKQAVILAEGVGEIGRLDVGGATGNGGLNVNPGAFLHAAGVIIGASSASAESPSYFSQSDGEFLVRGDFVLGGEGSSAQAFFSSGRLTIDGTLVLGPSGAEPSVLAINGGGGAIAAREVSIGSQGALVFDFLGGQSLKTLVATEGIDLAENSTLTVRNAAQVRPGETYILLSGQRLSGKFSQINLEGFDPSVRVVVEHDTGLGQVLLKTAQVDD